MLTKRTDIVRAFKKTKLAPEYWGSFLVSYAVAGWIPYHRLGDRDLLFPY